MKRILLALICIHLFADQPPGTVKQIAQGVWFREGDARGGTGVSNNIIIEMKDYLIVVDANYPMGAHMVLNDVKKLSSKPIRYVIWTHHHPDHSYGSRIFTDAGATTIAYVGAYEEQHRYEPQTWQTVHKQRKDMAEVDFPDPDAPMLLYTKSPYVITDGARRVELYHFGFGHTRGDTFVYLPKEKVLCTGDAVVNGPYSDPKNAYIGNWANEIRAAEKLGVEHVLPGHGDDGGHELLTGEIRFFETLYQTVNELVKAGKKQDDLVTMGPGGRPVATTVTLPPDLMEKYVFKNTPHLAPWAVSRFPTQILFTYLEITEGKPYGEIAGGK